MLSNNQLQLLCNLHYCIVMDSLFDWYPQCRLNINAPTSKEHVFDMDLLTTHIVNFFSRNEIYYEGAKMYNELYMNNNNHKKYLIPFYLSTEAINCVNQLFPNGASIDDPIFEHILGYRDYMAHTSLYKKLGVCIKQKNENAYYLWQHPIF